VITSVDDGSSVNVVPSTAAAEAAIVLAMPVVANPPVKGVVAIGSVAMTRPIPASVFKTFGCIAVSKVHVSIEINIGPTGFLQDAAEPSLAFTVDRALEEGLCFWFHSTSTNERVRTIPDSECWLSCVIFVGTKALGVIGKRRPSVVAALLVVQWKSPL